MAIELPELLVPSAAKWHEWLAGNHGASAGVWLVLAKKGPPGPTTLTYDEALDEALCFGWIDGQVGRRDESTFRQRFTPRRRGSRWSQRNVGLVEGLSAAGRMQAAGLAEVEQAQLDGRWAAAYAGSATIEVPGELVAALAASATAGAAFAALDRQTRFSHLYRLQTAKRADTRERLIATLVELLERGDGGGRPGRRPRAGR